MSAKAAPRCEVCKELVKGHKGKPGVANCLNVPAVMEERGARRSIVEVIYEQAAEEVKRKHIEESKEDIDSTEDVFEDAYQENGDQVPSRPVLKKPLEHYLKPIVVKKHLAKLQISDQPPRKKSVFSVTDDESTTPLPEDALASSFELPSFSVARIKKMEGRVSISEDVDVRRLVAGKTYTFGVCNMEDCDCD